MTPIPRQDLVYQNAHFTAESAGDCFIPGYLIMRVKDPVDSLTGMSRSAIESLGPTLSHLVHAIESVIRPERIYYARFGEEVPTIHFHLFPRTAALAAEFLAAEASGGKLNGLVLMNWARLRYSPAAATAQERTRVTEAAAAIRKRLASV